jgi:DNA repair exonuclease
LALGDTHSTASLGKTGRVWFSGSPETTDFKECSTGGGEADSGNALVVRIEGEDIDIDKRSIGRWTFEALDASVNSTEDVERFLRSLEEYPDKVRTAIKYSLQGTLGIAAHARLQRGLDELEAVFASLRPRERTMYLFLEPSEDELANLDISGYAADALQELLDNREDPVARDAANLLFRLEG